jgi:uncharacterized tellurite resistance protein B-like protein
MNNQNDILRGTIQNIFTNHNSVLDRGVLHFAKGKNKLQKRELEFALTVLLVDLASCDQNFDMREYTLIQNGLKRVFGTTKDEVSALVNEANNTLKNLRGSSRFAVQLKDQLGLDQRIAIMEVVNDVIGADGVEDGFETYLKHKFTELLDIPADLNPTKKD